MFEIFPIALIDHVLKLCHASFFTSIIVKHCEIKIYDQINFEMASLWHPMTIT